MDIEKIIEFIELLFYGSSNFPSYSSGININNLVSEIHKKYFGSFNSLNDRYIIGFCEVGLDGNYK